MNELLRRADIAMYSAKRSVVSSVRVFDEALDRASQRRAAIVQRLRGALERVDFELCFQPQMLLAEKRISGVEALLRWRDAELGAVSPAEFVPVAEECGLIVEIGEWVLRAACAQATRWRACLYIFRRAREGGGGGGGMCVSLCVSSRALYLYLFVDVIYSAIAPRRRGFSPLLHLRGGGVIART